MDQFLHVTGIAVPMLMEGVGITILVSVIAIILSIIVGFLLSLMCMSKNKLVEAIARIYIKIFRCTPFMVQVYIVYYGLPSLGIKVNAVVIGIGILALYNAAYNAVIIESGMRSVPKGQSEAAAAVGMGYWKALFRIVLPQTVSIIMPSLTGQFLQTVKDSSILSIITVAELTMMTKEAVGITFEPIIVYVLAGLFYWVINIVIEFISKVIEKRNRLVSF